MKTILRSALILAIVAVIGWSTVRLADIVVNSKDNKEMLAAMKRMELYDSINLDKVAYISAAVPRVSKHVQGPEAFMICQTIWKVSETWAPSVEMPVKDFAEVLEALSEHESGFKENAVNPVSGISGPWQVSYSLAKALQYNPVIAAGAAIASKTDLMNWEHSAPYAAAAFCLFYESAGRDLGKTLLYWHDGEPQVDRGQVSPAAKYLRDNVLAIIRRNKEMEKVS